MGCSPRYKVYLVTQHTGKTRFFNKKVKYLLNILLLLLPLVMSGQAASSEPEVWFTVTRVVDGDTFWVDDGSEKGMKIRLIGIDAPEPRNTGTRPKGFFGAESTSYLQNLLKGKKVRLEYDVARYDRYRRTLAYAFLEDGTFINAELVRNGYATVMTMPPNVKYAETFNKLASKARKQKKGLWKESPFVK
jgi:micrococcal nuclease